MLDGSLLASAKLVFGFCQQIDDFSSTRLSVYAMPGRPCRTNLCRQNACRHDPKRDLRQIEGSRNHELNPLRLGRYRLGILSILAIPGAKDMPHQCTFLPQARYAADKLFGTRSAGLATHSARPALAESQTPCQEPAISTLPPRSKATSGESGRIQGPLRCIARTEKNALKLLFDIVAEDLHRGKRTYDLFLC
jgi:hypothetical protein